jgi:hypothetical protein
MVFVIRRVRHRAKWWSQSLNRSENELSNTIAVPAQNERCGSYSASAEIPQADGVVHAASRQPATVWADCERRHLVDVAAQNELQG